MDLNKHEAYLLFSKDIDQELREIYSIDKTNIFFMLTTKILKLNIFTKSLITMNFIYKEQDSESELTNLSSLFFSDSIVFTDKYFGLVASGSKLFICNEEKDLSIADYLRFDCELIKVFDSIDQIVNIYVSIKLKIK